MELDWICANGSCMTVVLVAYRLGWYHFEFPQFDPSLDFAHVMRL